MITKIKQLFCKHKYVEMIAISPFQCISGERIYIVCDKCGKVKGSYFKKLVCDKCGKVKGSYFKKHE